MYSQASSIVISDADETMIASIRALCPCAAMGWRRQTSQCQQKECGATEVELGEAFAMEMETQADKLVA